MFQKGLFVDEPKINLEMRRQGMIGNLTAEDKIMDWKHIRLVTVPDELPEGGTDANGVNWTQRSEGGFFFGFNTDENGDTFSIKHDLFIRFNGGTAYTSGTGGINVSNKASGDYGGTAIGMIASLAKSGSTAYGWTRAENVGLGWLTTGYTNGGAASGNMQVYRDTQLNGVSSLSALTLFTVNRSAYGFEPGSTFDFWYR